MGDIPPPIPPERGAAKACATFWMDFSGFAYADFIDMNRD